MKTLLLAGALVVGLLTFLASGPANASPLADVIDATKILYRSDGGKCSLQFVRSDDGGDYVLTANHCVDSKSDKIEFMFKDRLLDEDWKPMSETTFWMKRVSQKDVHQGDVAVLRMLDESREFTTVDICSSEQYEALTVGDDITVVGFPAAGWSHDLYISEGQFLGETPAPRGDSTAKGRWLKTSAPIDGGSSGGALYMEREPGDYCLLGTTSFKDPSTIASMSWFSHPKNIWAILRGVLDTKPTEEASTPIAAENYRDILDPRNK